MYESALLKKGFSEVAIWHSGRLDHRMDSTRLLLRLS